MRKLYVPLMDRFVNGSGERIQTAMEKKKKKKKKKEVPNQP